MSEKQKKALEIGAAIVAVLIIMYLLFRSHTVLGDASIPNGETSQSRPNVIFYNVPDNLPQNQPAPDITAIQPNTNAPATCGCSNVNDTSHLFAGLNDLSDYFASTLKDVQKEYTDDILSSLPDYFTQYFNNTEGLRYSQHATSTFNAVE